MTYSPEIRELEITAAERSRFLSKIKRKPDGCWLWCGTLLRGRGYGAFWLHGKARLAHRVSHIIFIGPIPIGYQVDHLCNVRRCVNPQHLEAVTARENTLRSNGITARNAQKTHCPYGHPYDGNSKKQRTCRACLRERARARYHAQNPGAGHRGSYVDARRERAA